MPSLDDSRKRKLKLIEILLLIGSIIAAFNPEQVDPTLFLPFIILSLIYYITILYKAENWFTNVVIVLMSAFFSAIIAILYGNSVEGIISIPATLVTYSVITILLTLALMGKKELKKNVKMIGKKYKK